MFYVGNCEIQEDCDPVASKNEFGVDTLMRRYRGRADRMDAFLRGLRQKQSFAYNGGIYYLQTWTPDDGKVFRSVTMNYKGLINGTLPEPLLSTGTSQKSCTKTLPVNGEERTYEIMYTAPSAIIRYVTNSEGFYNTPSVGIGGPVIWSSYYIDDEGKKKSGIPSGLSFTATVDSRSQDPISGTPFFETEIVASALILP